MRVAWITTGFSENENDFGGAAAIHNLAKELSLDGEIELTIFSLYYPFERSEYSFYNAKVFSFAGKAAISRIDKPHIWRKCRNKFSDEHSRRKFDVIHSMWAGESGYVASRLSRRFNLPMVANICGGELAEIPEIKYGSRVKFWQKIFVNKSLKQTKKIVAGSDYIIEKIRVYYQKNIQEKVVRIPFGVDQNVFYPMARKPAERFPVLTTIGSAVEVKAYPVMLKAVGAVKQRYSDLLLKIYGRDDNGKLASFITEMGLGEFVELKGFIDYTKIPDALRDSDLFVLSSLYESENMSLIEAAFCGLPVVSTDVGAARDITNNLAQTWNSHSLAKEILKVLDNFASEKEIAYSRIEMLKQKFALRECTRQFVELYEGLV